MGRSSFDQVNAFMRQRSASVPADLDDDLEVIVRRCERVRNLGEAFAEVELSPYMQSLLRARNEALIATDSERASAAAGG